MSTHGAGCGCCPKCGCRATCTCNRNSWFDENKGGLSYSAAGETDQCGNCNCPAGTCAKGGSTECYYSAAGENGKCGANCACPDDTCAKEWSSNSSMAGETGTCAEGNRYAYNGECGANCSCPAGTCDKE